MTRNARPGDASTMDIQDHYTKALRYERTMARLDRIDDCEMIVWDCMHAGTHLLNCLLHHYGIMDNTDVTHSYLVRIDRANRLAVLTDWEKVKLPQEVASALDHLRKIEDLRSGYVRGPRVGEEAALIGLEAYNGIKAIFERLVSSE